MCMQLQGARGRSSHTWLSAEGFLQGLICCSCCNLLLPTTQTTAGGLQVFQGPYRIMKARWAPHVSRFTSMFRCMCQVYLSTDRSARASYRVRAIMMLPKNWLAVMYASQLVYVLHKKHKGGRLEQPEQSANHQEPASSATLCVEQQVCPRCRKSGFSTHTKRQALAVCKC